MKKSFVALSVLLMSVGASAGGSASREEILALTTEELAYYIDLNVELAEVGDCTRRASGERILPCSIEGIERESGLKFLFTIEVDHYTEFPL